MICRIYIYIYIYNSLNTLSGGKNCFVAPGVAIPLWATETLLSPLVGGWWGHGIASAFTRCTMKKIYHYHHVMLLAWIFLALFCHLSLSSIVLIGRPGLILNPYRAVVDKFWLIAHYLFVSVYGSIGVHRIWVRPNFSSIAPHVSFVKFEWFSR